jgi:hypothetical protein
MDLLWFMKNGIKKQIIIVFLWRILGGIKKNCMKKEKVMEENV